MWKEAGIPIAIWAYFIAEGIRNGLMISKLKIEPSEPLPFNFLIVVFGAVSLFGFTVTWANYNRKKMRFELWLEKKLTAESFQIIIRRARFHYLAAAFFALTGTIGLHHANQTGAPEINRQILQSFLFMGMGIITGWAAARTFKSKSSPNHI